MDYFFTVHERLFGELLAKYPNTFVALCELVNNSLQAKAKEIRITLNSAPVSKLTETTLERIVVKDDGCGVSKSEFEWKIMQVATDAKEGGKGIGRFAALQLGSSMEIETVAYDAIDKSFFRTCVPINSRGWGELKTLDKVRVAVDPEKLDGQQQPYYQVTITDFYGDADIKRDSHKRVHRDLLMENIEAALFARYAETMVRGSTAFFVNNKKIDAANYVVGQPEKTHEEFTALDGKNYPMDFTFLLVKAKSSESNHRVFLRVGNGGIPTVACEFDYAAADIPESNRWFVMVDSPYFDAEADTCRNLFIAELDQHARHLKDALKTHIDGFFAKRYEHYKTFLEQLKTDAFYPFRTRKPSSESRGVVFNQIAYAVENEHHLLGKQNDIRKLVYALIDRSLNQGDFAELIREVIKLDDATIARFRALSERVDLENVVSFCDEVARKSQFLDFLHEIVYGDIAKHVSERKQLHQIVKRHLWVFGESYNDTPILCSDKGLHNNLEKLRQKFFTFPPSEAEGNLVEIADEPTRSITDLFFYNDKILDDARREVMVVELKAPRVRLSDCELRQAKKYAFEIQQQGVFPENLIYKIILVSSDMTPMMKKELGQRDPNNRWVVHRPDGKPVEVWMVNWSELIDACRRKLAYLGNVLQTKDLEVREQWEKEFPDVDLQKLRSVLSLTNRKR